MTDLRKAAEMALEALRNAYSFIPIQIIEQNRRAEEALRQLLAQPEQGNSNSNYPNTKANTSLKHEPWCDSVTKLLLSFPPQIPPCNCKPKREWVGLTDEDLKPLCDEWRIMYGGYVDDFAKAIEAKLKEKNSG